MKKISFVAHGLHINKYKIQHEAEKYFSSDYEIKFYLTKTSREAEDLAERSILEGTDYLIAVGGDGTMHEVVNGIMRLPGDKREHIKVGLLPVGSGNDFARTLSVSKKISELHTLIVSNKLIDLDIIKLEFNAMNGDDKVRYCNNIADVGLGAEVAKRVNEGNKTYGPNLAFFAATLISFLEYKKKKIKLIADDFEWSGNILLAVLANAKYFGSGLGIAPHAKLNDGKIAFTLVGNVSLIDYLKNMLKVRKCLPIDHPEIKYFQTESCTIEPVGKECLIEADGEMMGKIPLHATVLHNEIKFLVK